MHWQRVHVSYPSEPFALGKAVNNTNISLLAGRALVITHHLGQFIHFWSFRALNSDDLLR